jgi:hypothetical protein
VNTTRPDIDPVRLVRRSMLQRAAHRKAQVDKMADAFREMFHARSDADRMSRLLVRMSHMDDAELSEIRVVADEMIHHAGLIINERIRSRP